MLHRHVFAEKIDIKNLGREYTVTFDWLCPHCAHRHWARERGLSDPRHMKQLFLRGGCVTRRKSYDVLVRFPWSDRTERDELSVYHQSETETGCAQ
jgi:hypothetical protein